MYYVRNYEYFNLANLIFLNINAIKYVLFCTFTYKVNAHNHQLDDKTNHVYYRIFF